MRQEGLISYWNIGPSSQGLMTYLDPFNSRLSKVLPDKTLYLVWTDSRVRGVGLQTVDAHVVRQVSQAQGRN